MTAEEYGELCAVVGTEREVARLLGVHHLTIRRREQGKYPIGLEAECAIRYLAGGEMVRKDDWARVYGSQERVLWVQNLPCAVCGLYPSQNCHLFNDGTGGMGRKPGYQTIGPLCLEHHAELHNMGTDTFQARYALDFRAIAARVQDLWAQSQPFPGES